MEKNIVDILRYSIMVSPDEQKEAADEIVRLRTECAKLRSENALLRHELSSCNDGLKGMFGVL